MELLWTSLLYLYILHTVYLICILYICTVYTAQTVYMYCKHCTRTVYMYCTVYTAQYSYDINFRTFFYVVTIAVHYSSKPRCTVEDF